MQISVREAARLLNISDKTLYRWIRARRVPVYKVGELYRFNRTELMEWAAAKKLTVLPEIVEEPESAAPIPTLLEALHEGGVYYRVGGSDKRGVLKSVVDLLHVPEEVDRDFLYQVLLARESLGSTGIGHGIAIPHPRSPIVMQLSKPSVALCFLDHKIDYGATDGKAVDTLFILLSPSVRAHLHLLSRLAFLLREEALGVLLQERAPREAIFDALALQEQKLASKAGIHA